MNVRRALGRVVLRWRTELGDDTAVVRNLELLADGLKPKGWRCVEPYEEYGFRVPLLWVYASGAADDVGALVAVRAMPGGNWGYFEGGRARAGGSWGPAAMPTSRPGGWTGC